MSTTEKINLLEARINLPLKEVVFKLKYPKPVQDLFNLPESDWQGRYRDDFSKLQSHIKPKEKRTPLELGKETVLAWILEDLVALDCVRHKRLVKHNGSDSERQFTFLSSTKAQSDLLVCFEHTSFRKVEITASWTDFFPVHGFQSFRFHKLENLQKENAVLLSLDLFANSCFCVDAVRLFGMPEPFGYYGKPETKVWFDHGIIEKNGDEIKVLPIVFKPIPNAFWRLY